MRTLLCYSVAAIVIVIIVLLIRSWYANLSLLPDEEKD